MSLFAFYYAWFGDKQINAIETKAYNRSANISLFKRLINTVETASPMKSKVFKYIISLDRLDSAIGKQIKAPHKMYIIGANIETSLFCIKIPL